MCAGIDKARVDRDMARHLATFLVERAHLCVERQGADGGGEDGKKWGTRIDGCRVVTWI